MIHAFFLWSRSALLVAASLVMFTAPSWANGSCPPTQKSASCSVLITILPTGALKFEVDPSVGPYDGSDDTLVGVVNASGATVYGITLTGSGIFGFDGDGAFGGGATYAGPGTSFSIQDVNSGTVNFDNGLPNMGFLYFSLEGAPSQTKLATTITIDPGHGFDCAKVGQLVGSVGVTAFPATNPPSGNLHEDDLTVAISLQLQSLLTAGGYKVTMTKTDAKSCPLFTERAKKANDSHSNVFVSVHVDAPGKLPFGLDSGSVLLYNDIKTSSAKLASSIVGPLASGLGVNNRGTRVRNGLEILSPLRTQMTAVIAETARLSGSDEIIMHNAGTPAKAAAGIKAGVDAFLNQ